MNVVGDGMRVTLFLLASLLGAAPSPAAAFGERPSTGHSISGTSSWVSRQGSVMVLDVAPDGLVRGYFVDNAPGKGCRGIPYDLKGKVLGTTISFQVRWRNGVMDCVSETTWHGHLQRSRNGGLEMITQWQRSSTFATTAPPDGAAQSGTDIFTHRSLSGLPAGFMP